MIFGLFKNWRFILDVIIVLVLVVALFIWNPFGIFGGKAKLVDTANMVTEVRQIGQLVTAEYYGEVISSLEEARMEFIEDETVREASQLLFADLINALTQLRSFDLLEREEREAYIGDISGMNSRQRRRIVRQDVSRSNIQEKMEYLGLLEDLQGDPLFLEVLEYWFRKENGTLARNSYDFGPKQQEQALFDLFKSNAGNDSIGGDFMAFYYQTREKEFTKKELRRKIALIGRGWVKAGFDFTDLDPSALVYYEDQQEIHIMGIAPTILNADINPWFIPEKGVPGFEILQVRGKVDFEDAKKVKEYCVRKLRDFAHRADILKNAERQGAETLENLFTLLIGQEIKKVVFHHDSFVQQVHEIESDGIISLGELLLFDSLYRQKVDVLDSLRNPVIQSAQVKNALQLTASQLKFGINRLKKLTVYDLNTPFNYFSGEILSIAQDGSVDSVELDRIRKVWRIDPPLALTHDQPYTWPNDNWEMHLWADSFEEYSSQFNSALRSLMLLNLAMGNVFQSNLVWNSFNDNDQFVDSLTVINSFRFHEDSISINYVLGKESTAEHVLLGLSYPFQFDRALVDSALQSKKVLRVSNNKVPRDSVGYFFIYPDTGIFVYGFPPEFEKLFIPSILSELKPKGGTKFVKTESSGSTSGTSTTYRIVFDIEKLDSLGAGNLYPSGANELYRYFTLIGKQNHEYQNRSVFKKLTGYVNTRLSERRNPPDWYNRLKKHL